MITVAAPPPDDPQKRSSLSVAPAPKASSLKIAPPPQAARTLSVAAPPRIRSTQQEYQEGQRNLHDTFQPHEAPMQTISNLATGAARTFVPELSQGVDALLGSGPGQHATNALNKVGTYASVPGDLLGAISRDLDTTPAGGNPVERFNNSQVKRALGMMLHDVMRLHNMSDAQAEYYLTGSHNLQALAATGDKTAQALIAHPWVNTAVTFAGELLNPINYTPAGISKLLGKAKWLQNGYAAMKSGVRAASEAHPNSVGRIVNTAQEVFGSGARHLDAGVAPGQVAQAHAARRGLQAAVPSGVARAQHLSEIMFRDAAPPDIEPALMAAQRRSKEAWLHQQSLSYKPLVQRAKQFLGEYAQARAAGHVQPSTPIVWERYTGKPSVFDLGEGNTWAQSALSDLSPAEQSHVIKIAQEMELAGEGPSMRDLSPAQMAIANRFRGVMGHTTAITRKMRPDILQSGEQIGHIPSRNIYFADEQLGSRGHLGVGEPMDEAKLLTLHRRKAIWARDQQRTPDDPERILSSAPYSALTPQQAVENFLARRYANLIQGEAQRQFSHIRSASGEPLVHEPALPSMTVNGATVIPQDRAALQSLVEGERELRAVKALAARKGISEAEAQSILDQRMPMRGVATGRAREAKQAMNRGNALLSRADQQAGKGLGALSDIGPEQVRSQLATEQALRANAEQGAAAQAKIGERVEDKIATFKQQGRDAAKRIIDKFVPAAKAGRDLGETLAQRPGSTQRLKSSRAALGQAQERFSQALQQFAQSGRMAPGEYRDAVRNIAQSLLAEIRMQQEPYWAALDELGGKIIPDQRWDAQARRYVDAGEFANLPARLRGSPKNLRQNANAEFRNGNLDEITDLIRERTGNPDLTTSDVMDFFASARKPMLGDVYKEARSQIDDMLGTQERQAQDDLMAARQARGQARGAHRENLQAQRGMSEGDKATVKGARALVGKTANFGTQLAKTLAAKHGKTAASYDVLRKELGNAQTASAKVGQRAIDTVSDANLRASKALQRGLSGAQSRIEQTRQILDRAAAQATDRARIANVQKQFAAASASQKLAMQQAFKRILKETPAHWPQPTYDRKLWTPIAHVQIHGRPLNWLDGEGKIIHRSLVKQLEYDNAPHAFVDDIAESLAGLHFVARAGMITNPLIHPVGNQGMLYALLTNDWKGFADHAATVLTALDPVKSINLLHDGPKAFNAVPNAIVKGAQASLGRLADFGWQRVAAQMNDFAGELAIAKKYHVYDETTPLGYDLPDAEARPHYDDKGKITGFETPVDQERQPAYLNNVPPGYLSTRNKVSRMYREFAKWNHHVVWETSEPLLAARFIRHFMSKGMDEAQAADAARDWLGSDKLTNFWRYRSGLLFPRWTRTVLWASMHLGLMSPGTWNVPLQTSRVQRESVGAGDIPTGAGPFAFAFPNGTDPNTGQKQFTFFEPHNPLGSTENALAGVAFGDPRYGGAAGHLYPAASYLGYRLLPEYRNTIFALPATAATARTGEYVPGSLIGPHDRSTLDMLRAGAQGLAGSLFMPFELGTEATENPFTIPASLTGSSLYEKHDGFNYPEGP